MDASLKLKPANAPAGDFRSKGKLHFSLSKIAQFCLELKISGGGRYLQKTRFCGEGEFFAPKIRLVCEASLMARIKELQPCEYARLESIRQG